MKLTRRRFLNAAALTVGAAAAPTPLIRLLAQSRVDGVTWANGYGPVAPVADQATGMELLELPEGFRYFSFGWTGDVMSDGRPTPDHPDGMAVVKTEGNLLTLVRNHEITSDKGAFGPLKQAYDAYGAAGTTNLVFNTAAGQFERDWVSLSGTVVNCAGGSTPWGTWISCEESCVGRDGGFDKDGRPLNLSLRRKHGYCFEVQAEGVSHAEPIRSMGRFLHEAVAIDPATGICYQTEDHNSCGFYRYLPDEPGRLLAGGKLQMLAVKDREDLRTDVAPFSTFDAHWVDIEKPDRAHSPGARDNHGVYAQGKALGATTFARLEGAWHGRGEVYFTSTNGGEVGCGQVWAYSPESESLRLVFESPGEEVMNMCDNITVSPHGGLLLCEDSKALPTRMIGLSAGGQPFLFAKNNVQLLEPFKDFAGDFRTGEWTGACFSPDGRWLFVNITKPGCTFAITGPWQPGLA